MATMRALLVEDDATIAEFVRKGLREAGFTVDHARDGEEGLRLALAEPYDAAVVDLMRPAALLPQLLDQAQAVALREHEVPHRRVVGLGGGGPPGPPRPSRR